MELSEIFQMVLNAKYIHLENQTASYSVTRSGTALYLFFEHSNGQTDWKNNLDFPAMPYRDMQNKWYVHRGFLRVWKVIEDKIKHIIMDKRVRQIVIAGYSHGAALALLCHEYCKFNRCDICRNIVGYGFGCPRVLWGFIRKCVKKRFSGFHVIRNNNDIVTYLPPALLGYRHVGNMIEIGKGDLGMIDSHRSESYTRSLEEIPYQSAKCPVNTLK